MERMDRRMDVDENLAGASCETRFVDAVRLREQMMQGLEGRLVSTLFLVG